MTVAMDGRQALGSSLAHDIPGTTYPRLAQLGTHPSWFSSQSGIGIHSPQYLLLCPAGCHRNSAIMVMHMKHMWLISAILSAVFAAATTILAKVGVEGVNSNLATAIRTMVVLIMAWLMVFLTNGHSQSSDGIMTAISHITPRSWLFLILSGLATGASWLFYFHALKMGDVNKVAPIDKCSIVFTIIFAVIFLGDSLTWKTVVGGLLLLAGSLVMIL